jgi:hypothetical protein
MSAPNVVRKTVLKPVDPVDLTMDPDETAASLVKNAVPFGESPSVRSLRAEFNMPPLKTRFPPRIRVLSVDTNRKIWKVEGSVRHWMMPVVIADVKDDKPTPLDLFTIANGRVDRVRTKLYMMPMVKSVSVYAECSGTMTDGSAWEELVAFSPVFDCIAASAL